MQRLGYDVRVTSRNNQLQYQVFFFLYCLGINEKGNIEARLIRKYSRTRVYTDPIKMEHYGAKFLRHHREQEPTAYVGRVMDLQAAVNAPILYYFPIKRDTHAVQITEVEKA